MLQDNSERTVPAPDLPVLLAEATVALFPSLPQRSCSEEQDLVNFLDTNLFPKEPRLRH